MIPQATIDELRRTISVSSVVGEYVKLTRRGKEYWGLSPFSKEKTESFSVNDEKGFYHCFSSGKHGDIFRFLDQVAGIAFPDAVRILADKAGLDLKRPVDKAALVRFGALKACSVAAKHYFDLLIGDGGKNARDYLGSRGVNAIQAKDAGIGYADRSGFGLLKAAEQAGLSRRNLIDAGLWTSEANGHPCFYDRIIFPIVDVSGNVRGFSGRRLGQTGPKYLNSVSSPIFSKKEHLFNLNRARKSPASSCVLVEGPFDALAVERAGYSKVVSLLGTSLSEFHLETLWSFSPELVTLLDADMPGYDAAGRLIDLVLPKVNGVRSMRIARLESDGDPASVEQNGQREALIKAIDLVRPLEEEIFKRFISAADPLDSPERVKLLVDKLRQSLGRIEDADMRLLYRSAFELRMRNVFSVREATSFYYPYEGIRL